MGIVFSYALFTSLDEFQKNGWQVEGHGLHLEADYFTNKSPEDMGGVNNLEDHPGLYRGLYYPVI